MADEPKRRWVSKDKVEPKVEDKDVLEEFAVIASTICKFNSLKGETALNAKTAKEQAEMKLHALAPKVIEKHGLQVYLYIMRKNKLTT